MRVWLSLPFLAILLGCPGPQQSPYSELTNQAQITPSQILIRPGGSTQVLKARVVQDPKVTTPYPLANWSNGGTFQWEIRGVPTGADGGHFLLTESGAIRDAIFAHQVDSDGYLLQNYLPPTTLPTGTTRLELKIRVTITPPNPSTDGGVALTEIPLVIDVNAPGMALPKGGAQEANPAADESRGYP